MRREATIEWRGGLKDGQGAISTESGALKSQVYSSKTRFEPEITGTNPEELVAGAHAACFSMALAGQLSKEGYKPESIQTSAALNMEKNDKGWTVTESHLVCAAKVPGIDRARFDQIAEETKDNCPISRLLNAKITLTKTLQN
jgi:osmotically inducible protein OsmC